MHSNVAMITLLTTSLMVTSWHDCWFQVARTSYKPTYRSVESTRIVFTSPYFLAEVMFLARGEGVTFFICFT
jgi:hypothetical protein